MSALCTLPLCAQSTTPTLSQTLPAQSLSLGGAAGTIELRNYFTLPGVIGQVVQFDTVLGKFNVEMLPLAAPNSVTNFVTYVNNHTYDHTLIHRSVGLGANNTNRIVQGGGYTADLPQPFATAKMSPIALEYNLANTRGTLAMARTSDLNSATSEWFFNVDDNSTVLGPANGGGYAVFGRVLGTGMTVVDAISALPIYNAGSPFDTIPLRDVTTGQASITAANLIIVNSVTVVPVFPTSGSSGSVLSFSVTNSAPAVVTAALSGTTLTVTPLTAGTATVTVTATDANGNAASGTLSVGVIFAPSAPVITAQPQPQIKMVSGTSNTVVFTIAATGTPAPTFQWRRNGLSILGKTNPTFVLTNASDTLAGSYTCLVTNSVNSVESQPSVLSFTPASNPGRVINLSILTALTASETMTMGTVLGGTGTSGNKALLARAAGPSLTQLGVTGVLPDPKMALIAAGTGTTVASNNDWNGDPALSNAFTQVGAFPYAASTSKDAAVFQSALAPGNYTVQVSDAGTGTGTVIAELYDSTPSASFTATTARLINVSVLKQPIAAGTTLTAGFVIGGTTAKTVLVRAIGPGLAQFGITGAMADPQLALFNGQTQIAANDNWGGDAQLTAAGSTVGAFAISDAASKDAMLLVTLVPGNYTAQVSGVGGTGGSAIVEVYEVP